VAQGLKYPLPQDASSTDPQVLRAALVREAAERRRAECRAKIQTEVVNLAVELLVREPDIERFFAALTKTMVEESESHTCGVWLTDETGEHSRFWMAYVKDRLILPGELCPDPYSTKPTFPCEVMAQHLVDFRPGWTETIEYLADDPRLPEVIREFGREKGLSAIVITPMVLSGRTLGWMMVANLQAPEPESQWWRVVVIEAIARQAALALHHSRVVELKRREERSKAILEERNRLARDIHDNLAQGFAAILMQLQGAQRELAAVPPAVSRKVETAIELARTHLTEARRSVGTLRPNVGNGEDIASALKRLADLGRRTSSMPIDVFVDDLPRFGDGVEREIIGIAQEALTNAVRHSLAKKITIRASTAQSVGLTLSVIDDGRGIASEQPSAGFGMTSMQERAERIGASLTIVTAPRKGTEVVLAWEPSSLPTQIHAAN